MQRKRWESEALEAQMKHMAEHDRRKDEFLAILAHELRNPLQPLMSALEFIEQSPNEPVSPRMRGIVMRQVDHLTRLVDDLLDVARFTSGKLELRKQTIALDQAVEEAVLASQRQIDARKHTLTMSNDGSAPALDADPVRLVQILCNLLHNAAKYTELGGKIHIESGTRAASGDQPARGFVRITDNGRGIPRELLPRVFDMFVQERAGKDGAGGLGLGLGLVKRLVDLHGGNVSVDSDGHGKGAVFEIDLPLSTGKAEPIAHSPSSDPALLVPRQLRAVVVDDAKDLRELVSDLLRMHGHDVEVYEDGAAALAAMTQRAPDVALIDIGLPGMDGYEVARRLRAQFPDRRTRLVAMTGYGQHRDRDAALEAGFDAHLVKPASLTDILRVIQPDPPPERPEPS
jgi:nitrogen-specific signal transduction histidine kinase/ActR/RegA family two-component response regulator